MAFHNVEAEATLSPDKQEFLQIRMEQVRLLSEPTISVAIGYTLAATILAFIQWTVIDHVTILIWITCMSLVIVYRILAYVLFLRKRSKADNAKFWEQLFLTGAIASGAIWGSAGIWLFSPGYFESQVATLIILIGIASGAVTTLSSLRKPIFLFLPLIIIPITINFFLESNDIATMFAVTMLIYIAFLASSAVRNYNNHLQNITLRIKSINREKHIRAAEKQLRINESRLAQTQRIAHLGGWEWEFENNHLYWSDEIYRIFGLKPGEIEPSYEKYIEYIHPEDCSLVQETIEKTVNEHTSFQIDHRIVLADGSNRFVHEEGKVQFNDEGAPIRMSGTIQDITEHAKLEQQLLQAQKMEAVGTLVGGIAHDFNNTLSAIQGNLYLAKHKIDEKVVLASKLRNIEALSFRAAEMVQQLLTFARKDIVSMYSFSLTSFMKKEFKLSKSIIPENIEYISNLCHEELIIQGNATQLQQVLLNLLNNAHHAVQEVKQPKITCTLEYFNANTSFQKKHPDIQEEHFAHLIVEDNGHGIPEKTLTHIFEPFFTTKKVGEGTGLGLAMVYGSVQTHGGIIEVNSKENEGSSFHIYLPLSQNNDPLSNEPEAITTASGEGETILLVDDETDMREATGEVLSSLGYKVLSAEDGEKAVELFKANVHEINLVISDLVMPKMGGIVAVEQMRLLNGELPVIFATGYDKERSLTSSKDIEKSITISKPFSFEKLSQLLRKQLNA